MGYVINVQVQSLLVFETLTVVDAVLGVMVVVTAADAAGLLIVVRVVVLVVNAGGSDLDGVMVTPEDEKGWSIAVITCQ